MNLLLFSILCTQKIGNLCFQVTPDLINPQGIDVQMVDIEKHEYLKTFWVNDTTMISQITDEVGCYQWQNEETQTSTCGN